MLSSIKSYLSNNSANYLALFIFILPLINCAFLPPLIFELLLLVPYDSKAFAITVIDRPLLTEI